MGKGRSEDTLAGFLERLTPEQRTSTKAVATDMAAGFCNAVEKVCPHAALVYDSFHVVAKYKREVVDVVRLEDLNTMYVLTDQFKRIWDYTHPVGAREALDQRCALPTRAAFRRWRHQSPGVLLPRRRLLHPEDQGAFPGELHLNPR